MSARKQLEVGGDVAADIEEILSKSVWLFADVKTTKTHF